MPTAGLESKWLRTIIRTPSPADINDDDDGDDDEYVDGDDACVHADADDD